MAVIPCEVVIYVCHFRQLRGTTTSTGKDMILMFFSSGKLMKRITFVLSSGTLYWSTVLEIGKHNYTLIEQYKKANFQ